MDDSFHYHGWIWEGFRMTQSILRRGLSILQLHFDYVDQSWAWDSDEVKALPKALVWCQVPVAPIPTPSPRSH